MKFEFLHPSDQLVMFMDRIYSNGMTTMSGGNISILDENGDIWITPSGIDKGTLTRNDICQVKPDGTVKGRYKPSVELPFHKKVYQTRKDVKSVVHAHPPALVSFSLTRTAPLIDIIPTPNIVIGKVGIAEYDVPGSAKLGENIAKIFKEGCNAVIMENHGAVTCGADVFTAFWRFETLEYCAKLNMQSRILGEPVTLTNEQIELLKNNYNEAMLSEYIPSFRTSEELESRRLMCNLAHRAYSKRLFTSTQGSFSQRLSRDSFLITPTEADRLYLNEADIVRIDREWREAGKRPSRGVLLHKLIYDMHPEINSISVAHPLNVMAFGITRTPLDARTIPESYIMMRELQSVPFGTSITEPKKISEMLSESTPLVLIENDSLIVTGSSLLNCFDKLEVADFTAKTIISAKNIGKTVRISDDEVNEINIAFNLK
ncbi:MAG: class II aldolase/adducin family protein [Clostridia bacterium]|nr:class II aldolase/adducin family protein [Clostridia bacterium]